MSYKQIFVFGSNLAGIHGAGAAATALKHHGAIMGQGIGRQGISYGIPTKDENLVVLPLYQIRGYIDEFIQYANSLPHQPFYVTKVGCGLAGYHNWEVAPMFKYAPSNCMLHEEWKHIINQLDTYSKELTEG